MSQAGTCFNLFTSLSCGFSIHILHRIGLVYHTVAEFGHVSFSEMWFICVCGFSNVPELSLIASGFHEHLNICVASGFPNIHFGEYTAGKEPRTFRSLLELRRSPWGVLYLWMKRRRSLFFGERLAIWSLLRPSMYLFLFWFLQFSGPFFEPDRIKSRCFELLWVSRSPMCILLGARLLVHHSKNRSTCARRRHRCLFSCAS